MMAEAMPRRRYSLADISEKLFNRPLAVTRDKAEIALGVVGPRLNVQQLVADGGAPMPIASLAARAASAAAAMDNLPGDGDIAARDWSTGQIITPYEIWNGAAILTVRGSLMAENGLNPMSGATGYDGLSYKLRYAMADRGNVKGIIVDTDSPGGEVVDLMEFCALLREASAQMPTLAIVRGMAASAGYAIAASCNEITAADYSIVGSIGSILMHADWSKNLENDGIDVTLFTSGTHKADFSPVRPLDDSTRAWAQSMVDASAQTFFEHVSATRKMTVDQIAAQQAACFTGQAALAAGLIDKIMPWDASMKEFAQRLNSGATRSAATAPGARPTMETKMSNEGSAPAAISPEDNNNVVEAAVKAAVTAERHRITQLKAVAGQGNEAALEQAIANGMSPGDFAVALRTAENEKAAAALADAQAEAASPAILPVKTAGQAPLQKKNRGEAYVASKRARAKA